MLILNSRRVVFIHLHRCAGSSVEVSLAPHLLWNDLLLGSTPEGEALQPIYEKLFGLHKHSAAAEVRATIGEDLWTSAFTFSTVRSPYDRAASLFNFVAAFAEPRLDSVGFPVRSPHAEQRAWVARFAKPPLPQWHHAAVRAYLLARGAPNPFSSFLREPVLRERERAFRTQLSQLADSSGRLLVDEVVRAEALAREWPRLCERIGVAGTPLVRANQTDRRFRRAFDELTGDAADVRLLNERFAADFEAFGYAMR